MAMALVVNQATMHSTSTDEEGNFTILAQTGDIISVNYSGYHTVQQAATPGTRLNITLIPLSVRLNEVVVLTQFQKDSIALTELYSKELNKKPVTVGFSSANGGGISGLIGAPIHRLSRSYKQNKRFKENFRRDMEQRYIDTRYTPAMVSSLTQLKGDSLALFMNTFPMDYGFARTASELEIKSWIRNNYKEYTGKALKNGQ